MAFVQRTIAKLPLLLKVMLLYVLMAVPAWWSLVQLHAAPVRQGPAIVAASPAPQMADSPASAVTETPIRTGSPVHLSVPSVGIELDVREGTYDHIRRTWTLSDDAAHFATMTVAPNDRAGNTLLYGHNTVQVLEPVKALKPGDIANVRTANGLLFTYVYRSDEMVLPTNTAVVTTETAAPQLTLLTCEGVWSQQRRLLYFDLKEVQAI